MRCMQGAGVGGPELGGQSRLVETSPVEAGKPGDLMCQDWKAEALFDFLGEKERLGMPSQGPSGQLAQKSSSLNSK